MRLREGKTRVSVLMELNTQESQIVTGFGAHTHKPFSWARAVALIGWKGKQQAFACVEAVGTDEELNCCPKRLTA